MNCKVLKVNFEVELGVLITVLAVPKTGVDHPAVFLCITLSSCMQIYTKIMYSKLFYIKVIKLAIKMA